MSSTRYSLGILDFGGGDLCDSPLKVIENTVTVAKEADRLGYSRYWLAEHHDPRGSWASPELVIAAVASVTKRLKVGSGGTLLNYHLPLELANSFSLLDHMFPDRIELGVGRGMPAQNSASLGSLIGKSEKTGIDEYVRRLNELISYFTSGNSARGIDQPRIVPEPRRPIQMSILGTNRVSAAIAAQLGLPFVFSTFHLRATDLSIPRSYIESFRPSAFLLEPRCLIGVAGVCAETDGQASQLAASRRMTQVHPLVTGAPSSCRDQVTDLAERCGTQDFLFLDVSTRLDDRLRTLTLLQA